MNDMTYRSRDHFARQHRRSYRGTRHRMPMVISIAVLATMIALWALLMIAVFSPEKLPW